MYILYILLYSINTPESATGLKIDRFAYNLPHTLYMYRYISPIWSEKVLHLPRRCCTFFCRPNFTTDYLYSQPLNTKHTIHVSTVFYIPQPIIMII